MIKKIFGSHAKPFFIFFFLGASITFAFGYSMQFHSTGNDFWNILYYGRNIDFSQPESLYNGFYPIGYAFFIGQMPFTYILPIAYILNALLSGFLTASVSTLVFYTRNFFAVCIAFFGSIFTPFIFISTHTIGPDLGAAAFVSFAVFLLWKNHFESEVTKELSDLDSILIGTFLGLGFLTRTHVVVSAIAFFAGYFFIFGIRPFRSRIIMVGTFLFFALLQITANLVSGHGVLETAQAYNIYKFLYGINSVVFLTPSDLEKFSFLKAIRETPELFFPAYWGQFRHITSFGWTSLLCFLLSPKGKFAKFSFFSFITTILYSIPIVVGDSPRAPLMIMSAYIICLALIPIIASELIQKMRPQFNQTWVNIGISVSFIALMANTYNSWILYDVDYIVKNQEARKVLGVIEHTLIKSGMKLSSEVFSDRYNFYTPNTMPYRSRQIGNWNIDWVWGYKTEFPTLPNDNLESFLNACREQGIRFLALSPNSDFRGEFFTQIYNGDIELKTYGLEFIAQRGNMRLYKIK